MPEVIAGVGLTVFFLVYVAPAFIAWKRHITNRRLIIAVSLLFGWLIMPWIVSLVIALIWDEDDRDGR